MGLTLAPSTANRPPRIILLGVEKIGKSTFASGAPAPVFCPIKGEEGIDDINVPAYAPAASFDGLMANLRELATEEHDRKTVVIDSASALEPLVWQKVCEENNADSIEKVMGGYGKGYGEALGVWHELCDALDYLREVKGMGCVIIGHVKAKRFDDPTGESYDRYHMDAHDKAVARLFRWADSILFANTKTLVRTEDVGFNKEKKRAVDPTGGARWLFTQQRPAHPGGGRGPYGQIPYELPLEWAAFEAAVTEAKEAK
jgi:hypothetical protein